MTQQNPAADAWRIKYLERTRIHLALVEYLGRPDATTAGALLILSGIAPTREA